MVNLPDWGTAIAGYINAFLNWAPLANSAQMIIGFTVGAILFSLFLGVFVRR